MAIVNKQMKTFNVPNGNNTNRYEIVDDKGRKCIALDWDANSTRAFAVGEYTIKDGVVYKFKTAHAANTSWSASEVTATNLGAEIGDLKSAINPALTNLQFPDDIPYTYVSQSYIKNDGSLATSTSWQMFSVDLTEYAPSEIEIYTNSVTYYSIGFYNGTPSSSTFIGGYHAPAENIKSKISCIGVPNGATVCYICNRRSTGTDIAVKGYSINSNTVGAFISGIGARRKPIDESLTADLNTFYWNMRTIGTDGSIGVSNKWRTYWLNADEYELIEFDAYTNSANNMLVAFYTGEPSASTYISGSAIGGDITGITKIVYPSTPNNAKVILLANRIESGNCSAIIYRKNFVIESMREGYFNKKYPYEGEKITVDPCCGYENMTGESSPGGAEFGSGGQDGDQYNGKLIRVSSAGEFLIWDLNDRNYIGGGTLGSFSTIKPHGNSVFFGNEFYDENDVFPLLYINAYNGTDGDGNPLPGSNLYVHRITESGGSYATTLVQTISIADYQGGQYPYTNYAFDSVNNKLLMIADSTNALIYSFDMPTLSDGSSVSLVLSNAKMMTLNGNFGSPQGCECFNKKLYVSAGASGAGKLYCVDLDRESIVSKLQFAQMGLSMEPEAVFVYDHHLVVGGSQILNMMYF